MKRSCLLTDHYFIENGKTPSRTFLETSLRSSRSYSVDLANFRKLARCRRDRKCVP